ncbi:hypothetical protein [Nocardia bovistercoris]|uniref:Uncharacterized protein n=1 Tax=Nocardia bovistercoris TaxID=2785916 RepID=A0A931N2H3_9NOCA|nr:hypothetical protein [Nocardia bovistercoris]MBH0776914.1 hypothetical protein [Nocardia bovistercoris]
MAFGDRTRADGTARIFGEPYETADGSTVITASSVHDLAGDCGYSVVPLGIFVIRGGEVTWKAADTTSRAALFGELIGLVTGVIATLALLRRPPWPDLSAKVMTAKVTALFSGRAAN